MTEIGQNDRPDRAPGAGLRKRSAPANGVNPPGARVFTTGRNRVWSEADDRELKARRASGENWVKTGLALGRSVNPCRKRYYGDRQRQRRSVPQEHRRGSGGGRSRNGLAVVSVAFPPELHGAVTVAATARFEPFAVGCGSSS